MVYSGIQHYKMDEGNASLYGQQQYLLVPRSAGDACPLATPLPTKPLGCNAPAVARPAARTPTVAVLILDGRLRRRRLLLVVVGGAAAAVVVEGQDDGQQVQTGENVKISDGGRA